MPTLETLASAILSWFVGPAIVGLIVNHFLSARIKTIEVANAEALEEIKNVNAANVEHLKTELRADAFAQEIRFSRIYDHQILALVELQRRAVAAEQAAMMYVYRNESGIPQPELSLAAVGAFAQHAEENAIWIPDSLIPLVKQFSLEAMKWTLLPTVQERGPAQRGQELLDRMKCGELTDIRQRLAEEIRAKVRTLGI